MGDVAPADVALDVVNPDVVANPDSVLEVAPTEIALVQEAPVEVPVTEEIP